MSSQVVNWDFRISEIRPSNGSSVSVDDLQKTLYHISKSFVFQLEQGKESGYKHFQGRFRLRNKTVKSTLLKMFCDSLNYPISDAPQYLEPTTNQNYLTKNFSYVMKDDTRINGPWTDVLYKPQEIRPVEYIPRFMSNINEDNLRPFQKSILESIDEQKDDIRTINVIVDVFGCKGKSTICDYIRLKKNGFLVPPINDSTQLIQMICDYCSDNKIRELSPIIIDIPRAMEKKHLAQMYTAIEQLKRGRLYETRYHFKIYQIEAPVIWVFTNVYPDTSLLSRDMWNIYTINDNYELKKYNLNKYYSDINKLDEIYNDDDDNESDNDDDQIIYDCLKYEVKGKNKDKQVIIKDETKKTRRDKIVKRDNK